MIRYVSEREKTNRILTLTSLTVEEFEDLAEPFEQAFVAHMNEWTMEGKPRRARAYSQYKTCPLPTPADRLLFLLTYMKVASIQDAHAATFGLTQPNANKWIHLLLRVLAQTLATLGDAPTRYLAALRERLSELQADDDPASLFFTTAPSGQSLARTTKLSRRRITAARASVTA